MAKIETTVGGVENREIFLELLEMVFSPEAAERKRLAWEWLFENPTGINGRETKVMLLWREGKPVGAQIILPCVLVINGKTTEAIMPTATLVHPDHRGVGLRLLKISFSGVGAPAACGLVGNDKLTGIYKKLGAFISPKRTIRRKAYKLGKVIAERVPLPSVIASVLDLIGNLPLGLLNLRRSKLEADEQMILIESFSDEFDTAWAHAVPDIGFAQARTKKFLNWRYADMPAWDYKCAELRRGGALMGYIVVSMRPNKNIMVGRVADLFAYNGSEQDYALLLSWADQQFHSAGCARSEITFGVNSAIDAAAKRCGFVSHKKIRAISTYVVDPAARADLSEGLQRFHFCRGDHDEDY